MNPCSGCGFWLSPETECCPGCGLPQEEESWWAKLSKRRAPPSSKTCLRRQELRIVRELRLLDTDHARLEAHASCVGERIETAESTGREPVLLRRSLSSLHDAIEHQKELRRRYRTLLYGVQLDWLENDLAFQEPVYGSTVDESPPDASFEGHNGWASCIAVSADSQLIASGGHDNMVRLWDIGRRRQVGVLKGFASWVTSVAFKPNDELLAAACRGAGAELWDIELRARVDTVAANPEVHELEFSPDGRWLAMSINRFYGSHALRVHSLGGDGETHTIETPHYSGRAFTFDPLSRHLAFKDKDNTIGFYDLARRTTNRSIDGVGTSMLSFSPDGRRLACGTSLRDVDTGEVVVSLFEGSMPACLAFAPDGAWLAVGSTSGMVSLWDTERWARIVTIRAHRKTLRDLTFSLDGRWLVTAGSGGVRLWLVPRLLSGSVGRFALVAERIGADEAVCSSAAGLKLFERAHDVLGRAIRSSLSNLGRDVEVSVKELEGLNARGVQEALERLSARIQLLETGASHHLDHFRELVDELPIRAFGPAVEALFEAVARQAKGLREADEGDCARRLELLEEEERRGRSLLDAFEALPEATRARPAALALRTSLRRTLDQLPELIDLIVARQTAAALGSLDPIAEQAPLNALNAQREALNDAIESLTPSRADDGPVASLPGKIGLFDEIDERAAVLAAIEEERHRFTSGADAVREVDQLLEES